MISKKYKKCLLNKIRFIKIAPIIDSKIKGERK